MCHIHIKTSFTLIYARICRRFNVRLQYVGMLCHAALEDGTPGRFGDGMQDGDQYTSTDEGKDITGNKAEIAKAQQAGQEAANAGANDTYDDVAYKFITAAARGNGCQETGDQANEKPG